MGSAQSSPSSVGMADLPAKHPPGGSGAVPPLGCPMHASPSSASLNPLNNIPELAQGPTSKKQSIPLPLERTTSSIPRGSSSVGPSACPVGHSSPLTESSSPRTAAGEASGKGTWEYPSPQQFYNALVRKGWETPEESVPMMVAIHNWMNEAAWAEVLRWESRYFAPPPAVVSPQPGDPDISLMRFTGRPGDLSPKARFHCWLGKLFPQTRSSQPPFDRHDWMIRRDGWGEAEKENIHRYVIDYYSAPDDEDGNPVFHLDVRPAIDDLSSLRARLCEWARVKREAWVGESATASAGRIEATGQKE